MNPNIERSQCQKLLIESTVKIHNSKGEFIGTGFFVLPNVLVSCYHVFKNVGNFTINISKQIFSTENTIIKKDVDLICIDLEDDISEHCIPLAASTSKINDGIWGFSYNSDYDEVAISSKLIETAQHKKKAIFRIDDDAITIGSSGTPLWNMRTNTLLGVVHWWKEKKQNAFVLPTSNFKEHFVEIYQNNIEYHQNNPYWRKAIEQDRRQENRTSKIPKYITPKPNYPELFIGRDNEIETVHQLLKENRNILLLVNGQGGIGKTTLASKYYYQYEDYYQHLVWVFSGTSIVDALLTLALPLGVEFPPKMLNEERFAVLLQAMAELNEPCLLIMDNANEITDIEKYHGALLQCTNFHILLTTRVNKQLHNTELYEVKPLEPKDALRLFIKHYEAHDSNEDDLFFDIYEAVNRNTLVVELLAKNLANFNNELEQDYSLSRLLENINDSLLKLDKSEAVGTFYHAKNGIQRKETPENIIAAMYDLSRLNEIEKRLLSIFSVLPAESIPFATLKDLITQERLGKHLLDLFHKGWLDKDKKGKSFRVSPVVQEVVRLKSENLVKNCEELTLTLIDKLTYHPDTGNLLKITYKEAIRIVSYTVNLVKILKKEEILSHGLIILHDNLSNYFKITGDINLAISYLFDSNKITQIFISNFPNVENFKIGLVVSYEKLGTLHLINEDFEKSLSSLEKSIEVLSELIKKNPSNLDLLNHLQISYERIGDYYRDLYDTNSSLEYYTKSNKALLILNQIENNNLRYKHGLSVSYSKLSESYLLLGEFEQALFYSKEDMKIIKLLCEEKPNDDNLKYSLSIAWLKLGEIKFKLEEFDEVELIFKTYNNLSKELYDKFPDNISFLYNHAISNSKLGECFAISQNKDIALFYYKEALSLFEKLIIKSPESIRYHVLRTDIKGEIFYIETHY